MKTISLKVPNPLAVQLARTARKKKCTKSAVVREVLEDYLNRDSSSQSGSCHDLAADLAGCVQGSGDISFNKKRLEGFGR
jgi:predicted transcriptional regulator